MSRFGTIDVLLVKGGVLPAPVLERALQADDRIRLTVCEKVGNVRGAVILSNPCVALISLFGNGAGASEIVTKVKSVTDIPTVIIAGKGDREEIERQIPGETPAYFDVDKLMADPPAAASEIVLRIQVAFTGADGRRPLPIVPEEKKVLPKDGAKTVYPDKRAELFVPPEGISKRNIIAIGASMGGTEAIKSVLTHLPMRMPAIVMVQHMPPVFTRMYAERLNSECSLSVVEAEDGDEVLPGRAYLAPGGFQMRLRKTAGGYLLSVKPDEKESGHCPSVDVLFESVAKEAGKSALGIILTGMGSDGARGLLKMRQSGAHTIGQDRESSLVYGMPKEAYDAGGVVRQLPLSEIPGAVMSYVKKEWIR